MVNMSNQVIHLQAALVHMRALLPAVERKDAQAVLTAASTTLAGFALVFLGIVITRPTSNKERRSEFRMIAGLLLIFWLDLLSSGCSLAWFYFNAPGKIPIPLIGEISPWFLYQAGWIILWLTAFAIVLCRRRDDKNCRWRWQEEATTPPGWFRIDPEG
jgi:hypothetical protein